MRLANKKQKSTLLEFQEFKCANCNNFLEDYECDHIVPFSIGGSTEILNLQLLCKECHKLKTKKDMQSTKTKLNLTNIFKERTISNFRYLQKQVCKKLLDNPDLKSIFIDAYCGTGKTATALTAYKINKYLGKVNRLLVITSSTSQLNQWLNCGKNLIHAGFSKDEIKFYKNNYTVNCAELNYAKKLNYHNKIEIYCVSVQFLCYQNNIEHFKELMKYNNWMVTCDEVHHYAHENKWGNKIKELNGDFWIGLSATPKRKEGYNIFENCIDEYNLIKYTGKQAFENQEIRKIKPILQDFEINYKDLNSEKEDVLKLSEFKNKFKDEKEINFYEEQKILRLREEIINPILLNAFIKFNEFNKKYPKQTQIIIHCFSVKLAKSISEIANKLRPDLNIDFAHSLKSGSEQIIKDFVNGKIDVLCHVNMFSEGNDNIRANIGIDLGLNKTSPQLIQKLTRHSRRNPNIPFEDDIAYLFIPSDSPSLSCAKQLELLENIEVDTKEYTEKKQSVNSSSDDLYQTQVYYKDIHHLTKIKWINKMLNEGIFDSEEKAEKAYQQFLYFHSLVNFNSISESKDDNSLEDFEEIEKQIDELRKKYNDSKRNIIYILFEQSGVDKNDNNTFKLLASCIGGKLNKYFKSSTRKKLKKDDVYEKADINDFKGRINKLEKSKKFIIDKNIKICDLFDDEDKTNELFEYIFLKLE